MFELVKQHFLALHLTRIVDRHRRVGGNGQGDILHILREHARPVMREEQAADDVAGARNHRHGEITHDREVSFRHATVRRVLAVARVGADIVRPHHAGGVKRRREHCRGARKTELLERFPRRSRQRKEQVGFFPVMRDVVKERTVLRARETRRQISDALHDAFQIEIA